MRRVCWERSELAKLRSAIVQALVEETQPSGCKPEIDLGEKQRTHKSAARQTASAVDR
jgi:hypothetical protein